METLKVNTQYAYVSNPILPTRDFESVHNELLMKRLETKACFARNKEEKNRNNTGFVVLIGWVLTTRCIQAPSVELRRENKLCTYCMSLRNICSMRFVPLVFAIVL